MTWILKGYKLKTQLLKTIPIIFLVFQLFVGCTKEKPATKLNVQVLKEFQIGDKAQEQLHRMYSTVMSSPDKRELAFSNYASPIQVVITDYEGALVEKIGKEGRGPDEIQSARYFGFDDDSNLIILDKAGAFFKRFNRTSKEVNSYEYPIKDNISVTSRNLQMCDNKWYMGVQLLGEGTHTRVPTIGVFNSTFNLVDTLGGYDPFFKGRTGIMQETVTDLDCANETIYTTHSKVPFVQVYSITSKKMLGSTDQIPPSFMLSDKFISMVSNPRAMNRFLSEEQSTSLHLGHDEQFIYHIFRNERNVFTQPRNFNDSDHYVAVYRKKDLTYLGEEKLPGAVLGSTKDGALIVLKDEREMVIQFLKVSPSF